MAPPSSLPSWARRVWPLPSSPLQVWPPLVSSPPLASFPQVLALRLPLALQVLDPLPWALPAWQLLLSVLLLLEVGLQLVGWEVVEVELPPSSPLQAVRAQLLQLSSPRPVEVELLPSSLQLWALPPPETLQNLCE